MQPKYEGEGRICAGVVASRTVDDDGNVVVEGRRLPLYDYSGKVIYGIARFDEAIAAEINRVRNLNQGSGRGSNGGWVTGVRPKGWFWADDDIKHVGGVGPKMRDKLQSVGIVRVLDLCQLDENRMKEIVEVTLKGQRLTLRKLESVVELARKGCKGNTCNLQEVDYRKEPNPYQARYGDDWETEIKKTQAFTKICSVKDLILHMFSETKKFFADTTYHENFFFYHDALTQMTDDKCVAWMKENGIYDHWIKPVLGCNEVVEGRRSSDNKLVQNRRYKSRPVGNSPEMNPLDNSLFRDVKCNLALNVAATWHLEKNDPLKFSMATPKQIVSALERIWDPENGSAVSSKRIVQDVMRIPNSLVKIAEYGGKVVPGLADRNGHRAVVIEKSEQREVFKHDKSLCELGIHVSIRELVREQFEKEKEKFFGELNSSMELTDASVITGGEIFEENDELVTENEIEK